MTTGHQVKHIALFTFVQGTTAETVARLFACLRELQHKVAGITEIIDGPYESPEGLNEGFTHAFIMTFESARARDAYLPHPAHDEARAVVLPHVARVIVFDFAVNS